VSRLLNISCVRSLVGQVKFVHNWLLLLVVCSF
ncbi:hypothetical protein LINPERHAP2_LOCUS15373, partial [Linum perenne]